MRRKTVTRLVLDNPYTKISWPLVSQEDGPLFVELLCSLLRPVHTYIDEKLALQNQRQRKRCRSRPNSDDSSIPKLPRLKLLDYITIGFNNSTKALELQCPDRRFQASLLDPKSTSAPPSAKRSHNPSTPPLRALFVARSDIQPPVLLSHFALACASASPSVKIVQLPKSAMAALSTASGLPDLGVVGLRHGCPGADFIFSALERVNPVDVPWLPHKPFLYKPLNVKQITTTAPILPPKGAPEIDVIDD
ncbi:uncharacterized protein V1518DRAFT_369608 [Limtongia smithiae]|uniref:uncharacterized protein n=1 Tax=Limtongia smithiae TaxID=1125753 RepID=UPI0034CFE1E0